MSPELEVCIISCSKPVLYVPVHSWFRAPQWRWYPRTCQKQLTIPNANYMKQMFQTRLVI